MDAQYIEFRSLQSSNYCSVIITLETNFHVNDVITAAVTCEKLVHVIYQLSSTVIYYQPAIHFAISIIG